MNKISPIMRADEQDVAAAIGALVPEIAARADEIERGARVPLDLLQKLEQAGAFRICVPQMFGGAGLPIEAAANIIEQVAMADASVAWHMMVAAGTQIITSRLPLNSLVQYYAHGADTWAKAALSPKGMAVAVDGGFRLSGRWPLASGAREFEWIALGFMIKDETGIRRMPDGAPDFRICLIPRGDVEVIETWDAVGLRGTRSDDLAVTDAFVPDEWQASFFGRSTVDAPTMGLSLPAATAPHHLGVVTGILKAAITDLTQDALTRKPAFAPTTLMKDDPAFRSRFGEIASRVDGLVMLADMCISMLGTCDREGRDVTPFESAKIASADSLVHHEATSLMDQIVMLSGSAGVYMSHRQQRRWRDLRCVAQHQAANIGNYAIYAQALTDRASTPAR